MTDAPKLVPCAICKELRPPIYYKGQGPYCSKHYNEAAEAAEALGPENSKQESD